MNEAFIVHRYFEASDKPAFLAEVGPYIRAIATRGDPGADAAIIDACPNLEIISVYGVGYDGVDMEKCRQRGIHVTNTPDILTKDVADFGIAMMLCQARGLVGGQEWARSGKMGRKRHVSAAAPYMGPAGWHPWPGTYWL